MERGLTQIYAAWGRNGSTGRIGGGKYRLYRRRGQPVLALLREFVQST